MLATRGDSIEGKSCILSGSGNVAQSTVQKITQLGGTALTMSASNGHIFDPEGIDEDKLKFVMALKNQRRRRIEEYAEAYPDALQTPTDYSKDFNPIWDHKAD